MTGKFLQGQPHPLPWPKIFVRARRSVLVDNLVPHIVFFFIKWEALGTCSACQ